MNFPRNLMILAFTLTLLAFSLAASCGDPKAGNGKLYYGTGIVESIDRSNHSITIKHEDIKDFMPAMTMPFNVKKHVSLVSFQPGDWVEFTLQDSGGKVAVIEIKKRQQP
jgi:Cu/Ag efflux protein CusF